MIATLMTWLSLFCRWDQLKNSQQLANIKRLFMELKLKDLEIISPVFSAHEAIPKRYTSDGEKVSPPLQWSKIPLETKQLVLICYDPDAPLPFGVAHWTVYNIPPNVNEIAQGSGDRFTEGVNSAGSRGHGGGTTSAP